MDKRWIVYYINRNGDISAAEAHATEQEAVGDALRRARQFCQEYYVAQIIGRSRRIEEPTYHLERV